jgi:hypothetical protein
VLVRMCVPLQPLHVPLCSALPTWAPALSVPPPRSEWSETVDLRKVWMPLLLGPRGDILFTFPL